MELKEFFQAVITTESGNFCLAVASLNKSDWREEWFRWPDDIDKIITRVMQIRDGNNVYFSPYLFRENKSTKANVLPSKTIVADLDEANLLTVTIRPSILVETSPERHQGYWILEKPTDTEEKHEEIAKKLTYSIPRCDRTGWFLGKKLRVPFSNNYKYSTGPKPVRIVDAALHRYTVDHFDSLPPVSFNDSLVDIEDIDEWVETALQNPIGPYELLERYKSKLPPKTYHTYDRATSDRSVTLWNLECSLFRAGATREEVFWIVLHSANNKFADLKYGGKRELAKDVIRAETSETQDSPDMKTKIINLRKLQGASFEKLPYISQIIRDELIRIGTFISCRDGSFWYIRNDIGRPIELVHRSESLQVLLETMFGINASEKECNYVVNYLISYTANLMPSGLVASLSYYDTETRTLFLHTGRREVLKVTDKNIESVIDGYQGIVFPWSYSNDQIEPRYTALDEPWYEVLLGDCLDNLTGMSRDHAMALLRVWVITLLLRNGVVSRPILALFGQPGAGKSTLFRRVYALLYGRNKALSAVTSADDFDIACASDPLVVLDNVDTPERWLPDRLALAAAASDLIKRKLYTNRDPITVKRQALLGITAHNPQFGREDVNDRLILLTFERLQHFKPETDIINNITTMRNGLWGAILSDIQRVMATSLPTDDEVPQFRVEDFARFGTWISKACGILPEFTAAVNSLRNSQKTFTLEEEHVLLDIINIWLNRTNAAHEFRTSGQLWLIWENIAAGQGDNSFKIRYRNAVNLGKKLWSLQDALKTIYDIEWKFDASKGTRAWRIQLKGEAKPRLTEIRA